MDSLLFFIYLADPAEEKKLSGSVSLATGSVGDPDPQNNRIKIQPPQKHRTSVLWKAEIRIQSQNNRNRIRSQIKIRPLRKKRWSTSSLRSGSGSRITCCGSGLTLSGLSFGLRIIESGSDSTKVRGNRIWAWPMATDTIKKHDLTWSE